MTERSIDSPSPRNIWLRGLLTLILAVTYHLASTLLFLVALAQFVLSLLGNTPNPRLTEFGKSLGRYQGQIANFVSFASEQLPFPFNDWPVGD